MRIIENIGKFFGIILLLSLQLFGAGLILAVPIMWLWNWLMVDLFHTPEITYLKAFGLYYFIGLLQNKVNTNQND